MPPTLSQAEILRRSLENDRLDIHTALPGVVRGYNANAQTADIALLVKRVVPAADDYEADTSEEYPTLKNVPVLQLRGADFFVYVPLAFGDNVLVLFCEADLNEWRRTGDVSDPGVGTRHGLSGAVCIPGLHHQRNALAAGDTKSVEGARLVIGYEGGPSISLSQAEIKAGGSDQLAKWNGVLAHLTAISTTLNSLSGAVFATPYNLTSVETSANTPTSILKGG